jgi:hypothetical protein
MSDENDNEQTASEAAEARKEYLDERNVLLDGRNNAMRSLEKTLVTLAAGALALSITFLHDIAPHPKQIGWMITSWVLLFGSLALMLTVFILGVYVFEKVIDALGKEYQKQKAKRPKCLICVLQVLEWTSLFFFILGSVFFAVFALVNLPK